MYFKSYLGHRAASCWALPHISSCILIGYLFIFKALSESIWALLLVACAGLLVIVRRCFRLASWWRLSWTLVEPDPRCVCSCLPACSLKYKGHVLVLVFVANSPYANSLIIIHSDEIWSENVRCSSKIKPRLRAEWVVFSEELSICEIAVWDQ